jgi:hypothetical protein
MFVTVEYEELMMYYYLLLSSLEDFAAEGIDANLEY